MKRALAGAVGGLGQGLQQASVMGFQAHLQQQMAQIQRLRDERLAELREQADVRADERRRAPYQRAEAKATQAIGGARQFDEDAAGNVTATEPTTADRARLRAGAYREEGLPDVARQEEEAAFERGFRNEQLGETRRYHDATIRQQGEELNLRRKTEERLSRVADVQLEGARVELDGKKEIRDLQRTIEKEADPTKRAQLERQLLTRLGKAKELPEPVKAYLDVMKAELGKLAEQEALAGDSMAPAAKQRLADLRRQMRNLATRGALFPTPTPEDIAGLKSRAGDARAIEFFDGEYGTGSAKRYLDQASGGSAERDLERGFKKAKLPGDRIVPAKEERSPAPSRLPDGGNLGAQVDQAREAATAARDHLMGYGSLKIKRDPAGYKAAQAAYDRALAARKEAERRYQASLGSVARPYRGVEDADAAFQRGFRNVVDKRTAR